MKNLPKTFLEMFNNIEQYRNINVVFTKRIEDLENYPELGMRGKLLRIQSDRDGVLLVYFDYGAWRDHNVERESTNYYDKNGVACLTATSAGLYKAQDCVFVMETDDPNKYMSILEETAVKAPYKLTEADIEVLDNYNASYVVELLLSGEQAPYSTLRELIEKIKG